MTIVTSFEYFAILREKAAAVGLVLGQEAADFVVSEPGTQKVVFRTSGDINFVAAYLQGFRDGRAYERRFGNSETASNNWETRDSENEKATR